MISIEETKLIPYLIKTHVFFNFTLKRKEKRSKRTFKKKRKKEILKDGSDRRLNTSLNTRLVKGQ